METFRRLSRHALTAALVFSPLLAQTNVATARLAQDDVSPSGFVIEGTHIPVTSTNLDPKLLFEQQQNNKSALLMKVHDVGSGATRLHIDSAKLVPPTLEVSRLVLGGEARFVVFTPAGNTAWLYLTHRDDTRFLPMAERGTWFLGPNAFLLSVVKSDASCDATTKIVVPNLAGLLGLTVVAQAVHGDLASLELTHPAAQTVRPR